MSINDLERHGILLPRKAWGRLAFSMPLLHKLALTAIFLLSISACFFMVIGAGSLLTWLGVMLFLLSLLLFTLASNHGIERHAGEYDKLLSQVRKKRIDAD